MVFGGKDVFIFTEVHMSWFSLAILTTIELRLFMCLLKFQIYFLYVFSILGFWRLMAKYSTQGIGLHETCYNVWKYIWLMTPVQIATVCVLTSKSRNCWLLCVHSVWLTERWPARATWIYVWNISHVAMISNAILSHRLKYSVVLKILLCVQI